VAAMIQSLPEEGKAQRGRSPIRLENVLENSGLYQYTIWLFNMAMEHLL
jgi:hypothetical protein